MTHLVDDVGLYTEEDNVLRTVAGSKQESKLEHPGGLYIVMEEGVFHKNSEVEIIPYKKTKLSYADTEFCVKSSEMAFKSIEVSIKVNYKAICNGEGDQVVPFVEINEAGNTYLLPGELVLRAPDKEEEYFVTAECEPFQKENKIYIGAGVFVFRVGAARVFHPVQHQFKIAQDKMEEDASGTSRRRNSDGSKCEQVPQLFYPACYPAAWAALCSAYRMTLMDGCGQNVANDEPCRCSEHKRRQWELGTPIESNPPPNEYGDNFSTWAMGGNQPCSQPAVTRVEDWRADPSNPTPVRVLMETVFFESVADTDPRKLKKLLGRANVIKSVLLREVGGQKEGQAKRSQGRPVRMHHGGHAWMIVGVDKDGFWAHAWGGNAWAYSDYILWQDAKWRDDGREYAIRMPPKNCILKPEDRRLGCISLEGSSDRMKRVRFWDVHTGLDANVIHWTPHTRTDPGYLWVQNNEPLMCNGLPESQHHGDLGHIIPRPINEFGSCPHCNSSKDGCSHCRSRLLLPFWIHNTTLDERVSYKVDIYFWSKDQRWVTQKVKLLPNAAKNKTDPLHSGFDGDRWDDYNLPGCLPGERFEIQAVKDDKEELGSSYGRSLPWNSKGFGWYIDFHRSQLSLGIHGIRLVLTCAERSGKVICQTQDVKQIWFRVSDPAPA
jgi:hypothetical protein